MTIETGLSDYHKMTVTVMKSYFKKKEHGTVNYRSYKKFNVNIFKRDLTTLLQNVNLENLNYERFKEIFMQVSNIHAPMKKKFIRSNNAPFMNKTLSKAFMNRSKLKNYFNKHPNEGNRRLYKNIIGKRKKRITII